MGDLRAAELLELWDRASGLALVERARALAVAADPDLAGTQLAALPLGELHAALLSLLAQMAGHDIDATATCPSCGEVVELTIDVSVLLDAQRSACPVLPLEHDGWNVVWHPPSAADVDAAFAAPLGAEAERLLLDRCTESAKAPDGAAVAGTDVPPDVRAALAAAVVAADPLAEVLVDLVCPACRASFQSDLDVVSFVWAEVESRARRVLLDVDELARAYGWTEDAVLALSERRRASYLRLLTTGTP